MMSDEKRLVEACPECDSPQIRPRERKQPKYRCKSCGYEFESPVVREPNYANPEGVREGARFMVCYQCGEGFFSTAESGDVRCRHCERPIVTWRALIAGAGRSEVTRKLAEEPAVIDDLPGRIPDSARLVVQKLKPPATSPDNSHGSTGAETVVYLECDLRSACRVFIEANRGYVDACLEHDDNPLRRAWSDEEYVTLVEQYEWERGEL